MTVRADPLRQLEALPDYPSLLQLRRSLHGAAGGRRAAVLVGAGFSRNAELAAGNAPEPPLWGDIARAMAEQLDPTTAHANGNPLRLAEEYRVAFGRSALEDLLRELMPDSTWSPGRAHHRLLQLPWTDVLTTNYDTLLERAAVQTLGRQYGVVRTVGDMATVRAPRVIKLHGSLPSHTPFILTEEDYRRYPSTHAAFVNLARQIFIENELVLLGFSGDDPNFLEWAGWVRDQLHDQSRRLYIIGLLKLVTSRRQLLLSKNIVPIDLAPLVADDDTNLQHGLATEALLSFLEAGTPSSALDWPDTAEIDAVLNADRGRSGSTSGGSAKELQTLTAAWAAQRLQYPGWLICPHHTAELLRREVALTDDHLKRAFDESKDDLRIASVREMAWLCLVSGWEFPTYLVPTARDALVSKTPVLDSSARLDIARAMLRRALQGADEADLQECGRLIAALGEEGALWRDFSMATHHLHLLNFSAAEPFIKALRSSDPVWKLRQAGLVAAQGDRHGAHDLYLAALVGLRERQLREPTSLWIRSRVRWAELLASNTRDYRQEPSSNPLEQLEFFPKRAAVDDGCAPLQQLERLQRGLEQAEHRRIELHGKRSARFDAGVYHESPPAEVYTMVPELSAQQKLRHVLDELALTGGTGHIDNFIGFLRRFVSEPSFERSTFELDWILYVANSKSDMPLIERYLNRGCIANLSVPQLDALIARMRSLIDYALARCDEHGPEHHWGDNSIFWIGRLNVAFEVLSRLSTRHSGQHAVGLHQLTLSWAHRLALRHWWLHESFALLLTRTWRAVHPHDRRGFTLDHLLFPLACEHDDQRMGAWPEPFDLKGDHARPEGDGKAERRVQQLLELARSPAKAERESSLRRLVHLAERQLLTGEEQQAFGRAYWSQVDANGLPENTSLWDFTVLLIANPDHDDAAAAFRKKYLDGSAPPRPFDAHWMRNVRFACRGDSGGTHVQPSPEVALAWLDYVLGWPLAESVSIAQRWGQLDARRDLGWFLSDILPHVAVDALSPAVVHKLLTFCRAEPLALTCLPALALRVASAASAAQDLIRAAMWSPDRQLSVQGALTTARWLEEDPTDQLKWGSLSFDVVALCGVARHPSCAWLWKCAHELADRSRLDASAVERLVLALKSLRVAADFEVWDGHDPQWEEQAPLALREATRTAIALQQHGVQDETIDA